MAVFLRWGQRGASGPLKRAVERFVRLLRDYDGDSFEELLGRVGGRDLALCWLTLDKLFLFNVPGSFEGAVVGVIDNTHDDERDMFFEKLGKGKRVKVLKVSVKNMDFELDDLRDGEELAEKFFDLASAVPGKVDRVSWPGKCRRWSVDYSPDEDVVTLEYVEENGPFTSSWKRLRVELALVDDLSDQPTSPRTTRIVIAARDEKEAARELKEELSGLSVPPEAITEEVFLEKCVSVPLPGAPAKTSGSLSYYRTKGAVYVVGSVCQEADGSGGHLVVRRGLHPADWDLFFLNFPQLVGRAFELSRRFLAAKGLSKASGLLCEYDPAFHAAVLCGGGLSVVGEDVEIPLDTHYPPTVEEVVEALERKYRARFPESFEGYDLATGKEKFKRLSAIYVAHTLSRALSRR